MDRNCVSLAAGVTTQIHQFPRPGGPPVLRAPRLWLYDSGFVDDFTGYAKDVKWIGDAEGDDG